MIPHSRKNIQSRYLKRHDREAHEDAKCKCAQCDKTYLSYFRRLQLRKRDHENLFTKKLPTSVIIVTKFFGLIKDTGKIDKKTSL